MTLLDKLRVSVPTLLFRSKNQEGKPKANDPNYDSDGNYRDPNEH